MGFGSGTFLKIQKEHELLSGQLFSIGKDLNFLVVIDRIEEKDKQVEQRGNFMVNANMFNENQEYVPNNNNHNMSIDSSNILSTISINFIENLLSKNDSSLLS